MIKAVLVVEGELFRKGKGVYTFGTRAEYDSFEEGFRVGTEAGVDCTGGLYTIDDLEGLDPDDDHDVAAARLIREHLGAGG